MRSIPFIIFLLYTHSFFCGATDNLRLPDMRTLGMGGMSAVHSPLFNPALLALRTETELRFDYYNRYALNELSTLSGGFCFPNRVLPVGVHIASFGYDAYRESLFRFSAGKQLNACLALGIGLQYGLLQSELFETDASRLSTDIGATLRITENTLIALSVINFPSVSLQREETESDHIMPCLFEMGFNWEAIDGLSTTGGIRHTGETPVSVSLGMEYLPFQDFHLRTGIRTAPFCPSLGVGYRLSKLVTDVALTYHPVLGVSTGLGLSYSF